MRHTYTENKSVRCLSEIQIKRNVLYFHLQPHFPFPGNHSASHLAPLKASGPRYNNDSSLAATTLSKCYILVQVHGIGQIKFFFSNAWPETLKKINGAFKIIQKDRLNSGVLAQFAAVGT